MQQPTSSRCRSCGAPVEWVKFQSGKMHPVNPRRVIVVTQGGQLVVGQESRFATRPDAQQWRRGHAQNGRQALQR